MKNPVIPYALIAGLGIFAVILVSVLGVNQRNDIQQAEEGEPTEEVQEGETSDDPEALFENNCASCHGDDLSGGMGPDLTQIGNKHSADEIKEIILQGQGDMPAIDVEDEQAEALADWLSEKQ
ncbi:cytochrome c [Virgibacillus sp. MSJ-26]|uniref:cytochrome c550 n=1 Tax=Virgibacillus sp. MSJ-26 TaxID=2841522 RepID=UPI001C110878|nr:cytochrome c [Virgibacillus sp. MSJ-26]MBU5466418.1 cytochrome c [Virgibacillus sp. MSJ-26]